MTDNSQAAHEAAYRKAVDASRGAGTFAEERRTFGGIYHEHMLAHLRPAIEAQAREAALREAAAIQAGTRGDLGDQIAEEILALIQKEPTNAG